MHLQNMSNYIILQICSVCDSLSFILDSLHRNLSVLCTVCDTKLPISLGKENIIQNAHFFYCLSDQIKNMFFAL